MGALTGLGCLFFAVALGIEFHWILWLLGACGLGWFSWALWEEATRERRYRETTRRILEREGEAIMDREEHLHASDLNQLDQAVARFSEAIRSLRS